MEYCRLAITVAGLMLEVRTYILCMWILCSLLVLIHIERETKCGVWVTKT